MSDSKTSKNPDEQLDNLERGLKKSNIKSHYVLSSVILILMIALLVLGFLGGLKQIQFIISKKFLKNHSKIKILSIKDYNLLILAKDANKREVKYLNTQKMLTQDISSGDFRASHAAISPDGNLIAYVSTENSSSKMYIVNNSIGLIQIFDSKSFENSAGSIFNQASACVCEWSNIYWSPDNNKLAFFGCSDKSSALFVVNAKENDIPKALVDTKTDSIDSREAAWLKDKDIIFTSGITKKKTSESLYIINLDKKDSLKRLYGPLK